MNFKPHKWSAGFNSLFKFFLPIIRCILGRLLTRQPSGEILKNEALVLGRRLNLGSNEKKNREQTFPSVIFPRWLYQGNICSRLWDKVLIVTKHREGSLFSSIWSVISEEIPQLSDSRPLTPLPESHAACRRSISKALPLLKRDSRKRIKYFLSIQLP